MRLKLNLIHPTVKITNKIVEIEISNNLSPNELIDWVYKNKKEILKNNGCNLTEIELASALALGAANVKIIK